MWRIALELELTTSTLMSSDFGIMFFVSGEISVSPHQGLRGGEAGTPRSVGRLKDSLFAPRPAPVVH